MTRRAHRARRNAKRDHSERNFVLALALVILAVFPLAFPEIASAAARWLLATMH